jgi:hypothetical protein
MGSRSIKMVSNNVLSLSILSLFVACTSNPGLEPSFSASAAPVLEGSHLGSASTFAPQSLPDPVLIPPTEPELVLDQVIEPELVDEPEALPESPAVLDPEPAAVDEPEALPESPAVLDPEPAAVDEPEALPESPAVLDPEPATTLEPAVATEPAAVPENEPTSDPEPEPVLAPEPPSTSATSSEASRTVSKTTLIADLQGFVLNLNAIIQAKDYDAWLQYLTPAYINYWSDPETLTRVSESLVLRRQNLVLRSLRDYFDHVVYPSRQVDRIDDIEFLENSIRVITINTKGERLVLYNLEKIGDTWFIANRR